jgi:hypothetical protein
MSAVETLEAPATASQSPADARERLAKLFGMLGSAHKGERGAALHAIDKAMQSSGTSWADVAAAIAVPPCGWRDAPSIMTSFFAGSSNHKRFFSDSAICRPRSSGTGAAANTLGLSSAA